MVHFNVCAKVSRLVLVRAVGGHKFSARRAASNLPPNTQDGERVNMQGNNFQITLRIGWPDPLAPPLGSAGAEDRLEDVRSMFQDRVQFGK